MKRKNLEESTPVYLGDVYFHGDRMVSVTRPEVGGLVQVSYHDAPPVYQVQNTTSKNDTVPVNIISNDQIVKKTDLSYPTDKECRIIFLRGLLSTSQALNGFDNKARAKMIQELRELGDDFLKRDTEEILREEESVKIYSQHPLSDAS